MPADNDAVAAAQSAATHARLLGAAETLRANINASINNTDEQADFERELAALHTQLDETTFRAEWTAGEALTMEEAIALALAREKT